LPIANCQLLIAQKLSYKKNTMTSVKLAFYARVALVLHGIALALLFMYLGRTIVIPLFFSFLISILLEPLVKWFEKMHFPRSLAAILSLLVFIIVIGVLVYFFSSQVARFTKDLPHLEQKISGKFQNIRQWITEKYHVDDDTQINYMEKSANGVVNAAAGGVATTFVGIAQFLILTLFFLVFTFFMLYHRRLLVSFVTALFNSNHSKKVITVIKQIRSVIKSYVVGLLTEMAILIVLIFATLSILGIKYALLMSVMAAVLNIIPYLGIYTAMFFSILITLANGTSGDAITIGVVFLIAHFIDANIILPRIVGGRVKLNPFITIIAVLIGHLLWGIPGMFLFIPLTAILRIISEEVDDLAPWAILIGEEKK
jgi:AI-2 transport protein TqsA